MPIRVELLPRWWRDRALLARPIGSLAQELDEYERADPARTALLAWTVAGWMAMLSLLRVTEAIWFAIALFIVIYRLPASLRVVMAALRSPPGLLVVGYLAWTALATALGPEPAPWREFVPKRMFLVPIIVLPVLTRWRLLLLGLVAGGAIEAVYLLVAALLSRGPVPSIPREIADGATAPMAAAVAAGLLAAMAARWRVRVAGAALAALALAMQAQASMRAAVAGSIAGVLALALAAGGKARWTVVALLGAVAAFALAGSMIFGGLARESVPEGGPRADYGSLNQLSSNRLELWRLTLEAAADRPIVGHGRASWRAEIDAMRGSQGEIAPYVEQIWTFRAVQYGHNTLLDVFYESGAVGLFLILAAAAIVMRAAWRARTVSRAALLVPAVLAAACMVAQLDFVFQRSIPGALLIAASCLSFAPGATRHRTPAGADAWLERVLAPRP